MDKTITLNTVKYFCWLCGSPGLKLVKNSNVIDEKEATSQLFEITDYSYGKTFAIYRCMSCKFMQCSKIKDVVPFYKDLQDQSYEDTRKPRLLQMKKILEIVQKYKPNGKLLDIGAGSGILVEEALSMGYVARGLEPSKWLQEKAMEHNLPVDNCTLDEFKSNEKYDVVTIIDVIEHVLDPIKLLSVVYKIMKNDGIVVVVTPNIGSLTAKILGWKWWHFRIAHIGYFNKHTLNFAFSKCGFELIKMQSPSWYFYGEYIMDRINKYLPIFYKPFIPSFFKKMIFPLNFQDSMLGIYTPKKDN